MLVVMLGWIMWQILWHFLESEAHNIYFGEGEILNKGNCRKNYFQNFRLRCWENYNDVMLFYHWEKNCTNITTYVPQCANCYNYAIPYIQKCCFTSILQSEWYKFEVVCDITFIFNCFVVFSCFIVWTTNLPSRVVKIILKIITFILKPSSEMTKRS